MSGIYNYGNKNVWTFVRVENDTLVTGYRQTAGWARTRTVYFAMTFSKPIKKYGHLNYANDVYKGFWRKFDQANDFPEMAGRQIRAWFDFNTQPGEKIRIKFALSPVSTAGALNNLRTEAPGWDFDAVKKQGQADWNRELAKIRVNAFSNDDMVNFYTAMYHTFLGPTTYMDVDGGYRGLDQLNHQADGFTNYTTFSLWDTYRALHPFFNIIQPQRNADMVRSMLEHYDQSVHKMLPVWSHYANENWCMIGYHSVSVVSDAIMKGNIKGYDANKALEACAATARYRKYDGLGYYMDMGYVPEDKNSSSVSKTLEYAYDDFTIYKLAVALKRPQAEIDRFAKRSQNFRNIFDPETRLMRGKNKDGKFQAPFNPFKWGDAFTEGNSWHYTWSVFHDVQGLAGLMGGREQFARMLDSVFVMAPVYDDSYYGSVIHEIREMQISNMGQYAHGNQPIQHMIYLYNYAGQPWKAQYWLRQVMDKLYHAGPDGYCGDEDNGQTSAWYVFTAMGFYPVCPGTDQYVLGAPLFPKTTVTLENGKRFVIEAPGNSATNLYTQSVLLNGKAHTKNWISHSAIQQGGVMRVNMGAQPEKTRGTKEEAFPYSYSTTNK